MSQPSEPFTHSRSEEDNLHSLLRFDSLESAEKTLREVHERFVEYTKQSDRRGVELCREVILQGKQRASMISRNKKVNEAKRKEKAEIAHWFTVWLQTPDIFFDWLELRKVSAEFHAQFVEKEV